MSSDTHRLSAGKVIRYFHTDPVCVCLQSELWLGRTRVFRCICFAIKLRVA